MFLLSSYLLPEYQTVETITLDLFQNCDVPEEVSVTLDPEVNDDAVGTVDLNTSSFILFAIIMQKKIFKSLQRCSREPSQVGSL